MIQFFPMIDQAIYYLVITSLTFIGFALVRNRLPLLYSKFIGIVIVTIVAWLVGFIGITSWQTGLVFFVIILGLYGIYTFYTHLKDKKFKQDIKHFLVIELIGFIIFVLLNYVRSTRADIMGTERPMDFSFMYSFLKQPHMPPENPWLAGTVLNYYYLGQFTLSIFTFLTHTIPGIGYNLTISLWGVFIFQAIYIFLYSIKKVNIGAVLRIFIASLVAFAGNFYHVVYYIKHHNMNFFFPASTRIIPRTINEFPAYSVVLGDMHGHYISLPFLIINLGLLYFIFMKLYNPTKKNLNDLVYLAISFALITFWEFATNAWDVIPLMQIVFILGLILLFKHRNNLIKFIKKTIPTLLPSIAILGVLFGLFKVYYLTPTNGLGWGFKKPKLSYMNLYNAIEAWGNNLSFKLLHLGQYFYPFFLLLRVPFIILIDLWGYIWFYINSFFVNQDVLYYHLLFLQFGILLVILLFNYIFYKNKHLSKRIKIQTARLGLYFLLIVLFIGSFNIIAVNFVWIKDVFSKVNPPYTRANTVFKIYYQAWALVVSSLFLLIFFLTKQIKKRYMRYLWSFLPIIVGVTMLIYFPKALYDNFGLFKKNANIKPSLQEFLLTKHFYPTLVGDNFLKGRYPVDYDILQFVKRHTDGKPPVTILEAITYTSYSYYGRIAINSGNRLITGWPFHNVQWYNGYDFKAYKYDLDSHKPIHRLERITIGDKVNEVDSFYKIKANTPEEREKLINLIKQYRINYIIIGQLEYETYPEDLKVSLPILRQLCPTAFIDSNKYFILDCKNILKAN